MAGAGPGRCWIGLLLPGSPSCLFSQEVFGRAVPTLRPVPTPAFPSPPRAAARCERLECEEDSPRPAPLSTTADFCQKAWSYDSSPQPTKDPEQLASCPQPGTSSLQPLGQPCACPANKTAECSRCDPIGQPVPVSIATFIPQPQRRVGVSAGVGQDPEYESCSSTARLSDSSL